MTEEKISTTDLLNLLRDDISLFYLPYAPSPELKREAYEWRKKILKIIEQRIDDEYNNM